MKRRKFIRNAALATATTVAVPYILPSGRLFAATGARKVDHVVFCLFAGGIRNIETVKQGQSNLMETMLNGAFTPQIGINDVLPTSPLGGSKLQDFGTLYSEFRFVDGPTGHYNGHVTAVTGQYSYTNVNIKTNPDLPTVFEYYRKHNSPSNPEAALNAWWVSDSAYISKFN